MREFLVYILNQLATELGGRSGGHGGEGPAAAAEPCRHVPHPLCPTTLNFTATVN